MQPFRFFIAVAICVCATGVSAAPANEQTLETLVVTATRLQQDLTEVGSSVYVITAEQIQAMGHTFVVDALAAAPGVTINQNGAYGGAASVRIRGAASEQTLVLIDGVAVNDPSAPGGGYDFSRLDPASVARIEIMKGPQSTLWGSDAMGGVIHITTKRGTTGMGGGVFVEYGSHDTGRAGLELAAGNDRGDFRLGINRTDSQGISKADEDNGAREKDGFESTSISATGNLNLPGQARLGLSLLSTDAETDFDSFVFGLPGNVGDGDESSETEERSAQLRLEVPQLDDRLRHTLTVGHAQIDRQSFAAGTPTFGAEGERQVYRYQGQWQITDTQRLAFGYEHERYETDSFDNDLSGLYGLYEWQPSQALTLTLGVRSDDIDGFDRETTGRFAFAYQVHPQFTLRGSWGQGFKAPTLFQTTFFCCGATAANPSLAPEESDAYDLGLDWRSADRRSSASLTYFNQDTTNLIDFSFFAGGYENIASADSNGIELDVAHQFNDWLQARVSYAYIDATGTNGDDLLRVPHQTGQLRLTLVPAEHSQVSIVARYNDDERDVGGTVDSWVRVDLAGQYQLSSQVEMFAAVENLFDEDYQQLLGYGTPGLSVRGGLRWRF